MHGLVVMIAAFHLTDQRQSGVRFSVHAIQNGPQTSILFFTDSTYIRRISKCELDR